MTRFRKTTRQRSLAARPSYTSTYTFALGLTRKCQLVRNCVHRPLPTAQSQRVSIIVSQKPKEDRGSIRRLSLQKSRSMERLWSVRVRSIGRSEWRGGSHTSPASILVVVQTAIYWQLFCVTNWLWCWRRSWRWSNDCWTVLSH